MKNMFKILKITCYVGFFMEGLSLILNIVSYTTGFETLESAIMDVLYIILGLIVTYLAFLFALYSEKKLNH